MERGAHPLAVKSQKWLAAALLELMRDKPYGQITVSELCRRAQVDRRTFYRNFQDKDDLMAFYVSALEAEYLSALGGVEVRTVYTMALAQSEFWRAHAEFLRALESSDFLVGLLLRTANAFIPGLYPQFHTRAPERFPCQSAFVTGGFCNVLLQWAARGAEEPPGEIAAAVAELFDDKNSYWSYI